MQIQVRTEVDVHISSKVAFNKPDEFRKSISPEILRNSDYTFLSKDGYIPTRIELVRYEHRWGQEQRQDYPNWQGAYAHELGHILSISRTEIFKTAYHDTHRLRSEILAWRLAKSYTRPELWSDQYALASLETYIKNSFRYSPFGRIRILQTLKKIGIIPLNRGVKLIKNPAV